jgi:membrane associated rhomboid family serine protease
MITVKKFQNVPVSVFMAVTIIVIFLLYATTIIKTIPCNKDILSTFYSNFIHIDFYHLIGNLIAFYGLSRIEQNLGTKNFILLIVFLLVFNTLAETIIYKLFPSIKCSIGFSGVLFGLITWELIKNKQLDITLIASILFMVFLPSIQNPKASLSGHLVGAIAGILSGIIWAKLYKNKDNYKESNFFSKSTKPPINLLL